MGLQKRPAIQHIELTDLEAGQPNCCGYEFRKRMTHTFGTGKAMTLGPECDYCQENSMHFRWNRPLHQGTTNNPVFSFFISETELNITQSRIPKCMMTFVNTTLLTHIS